MSYMKTGLSNLRIANMGSVFFCGEVVFGASGAVSSQDFVGATITKPTGTGLYRVTLDERFNRLVAAGVILYNGGTAADVDAQLTTRALASNVSFDFTTMSAGSAANATSGHSAFIWCVVKNTDIGPSGT